MTDQTTAPTGVVSSTELGQSEKQADWYAGMTEKHFDIAISRAVAAERKTEAVVYRALVLAAMTAPEPRTAGETRAAAVTLFGAEAVAEALARM
jgi:hypothetical protein